MDRVRLPPMEPVKLLCDPPPPDASRDLDSSAMPPAPTAEFWNSAHWNASGEFLSAERIGYVEDRDHVVGFEPHAMTQPLQSRYDLEDWQVIRLELVSLLRFESPRVYESEYLPNMELLSSGELPTRELDEFEASALPQLRSDLDVVIDEPENLERIRMLGSLRADEDCAKCHAVNRGELLGAFSYEFIRRASDSGHSGPE